VSAHQIIVQQLETDETYHIDELDKVVVVNERQPNEYGKAFYEGKYIGTIDGVGVEKIRRYKPSILRRSLKDLCSNL
jgi:hypothetical protein